MSIDRLLTCLERLAREGDPLAATLASETRRVAALAACADETAVRQNVLAMRRELDLDAIELQAAAALEAEEPDPAEIVELLSALLEPLVPRDAGFLLAVVVKGQIAFGSTLGEATASVATLVSERNRKK